MEKKNKRINCIPVVIVIIMPLMLFLIETIMPDRENSVLESKSLMTSPFKDVHIEDYINGNIFENAEKYVSEQLPVRDEMVQLYTDMNVCLGRKKMNGVVYTNEGYYIQPKEEIDSFTIEQYANKTILLKDALQAKGIPFVTVVGATKESILGEESFPIGIVNNDASELNSLKYCSYLEQAQVENFSLFADMEALYESGEFPFYYTDHHWNYLGAYAGYARIADYFYENKLIGEPHLESDSFVIYTDSHLFFGSRLRVFGGTLFQNSQAETIMQYLPKGEMFSIESDKFDERSGTSEVFMFPDRYQDNQKYRNYYNDILWGYDVNPVLTNYELQNGPVLLLLGDSYSQSLSPMLMAHFSKIYLIDVRAYEESISELAEEVDADVVMLFISNVADDRFSNLNP